MSVDEPMPEAAAGPDRANFLFHRFTFDLRQRWIENEFRVYLLTLATPVDRHALTCHDLLEGSGYEPQPLTGRRIAYGALDADGVRFQAIAGTRLIHSLLIAEISPEGTPLPALFVGMSPGLPMTPNGGDVLISWDAGAERICRPHPRELQ
jgi:hypothetical protein